MCLVLGIARIVVIKIMCSLRTITPAPADAKKHSMGFWREAFL